MPRSLENESFGRLPRYIGGTRLGLRELDSGEQFSTEYVTTSPLLLFLKVLERFFV